jgi:hypothetical protein
MGTPSTGVALRVVGVVAAAIAVGSCNRDPRTPEEAAARGRERIRAMGETLGKAQAFSFETSEMNERVRRNGEKANVKIERRVIVRRPDRMWVESTRPEGPHTTWYDGKTLTVVVPGDKVFARVDVPPTLDATLDMVTTRLDVPLPYADFVYTAPHESFPLDTAKGGWVRRADVDGRACDEFAYQLERADFTVWIGASDTLPCRIDITYKARPGAPKSVVTFRNWNLSASIPENQFAAVVPAGFEQIPVVEHIPVDQVKETMGLGSTPIQAVPTTPPPAKPPAKP